MVKSLNWSQKREFFHMNGLINLKKLNETKLPSQREFYSKLRCSGIEEEDYEHAINVLKTFDMETFKDYPDLYIKTYVLLLADVFEILEEFVLTIMV